MPLPCWFSCRRDLRCSTNQDHEDCAPTWPTRRTDLPIDRMSCCTASGTSWAEAPGRAYSPFLLRFMHLFAGHKVVYTSIVVRGSPWARHPPAGHERAPNCASAGRSGGCIARHKCSMEVGGVGERYNGAFRGPQRGGVPARFSLPAQPSPAQWEVRPGVPWNGIIFAPDFCAACRATSRVARAWQAEHGVDRAASQAPGPPARRPAPKQALSCARRWQSLPRC